MDKDFESFDVDSKWKFCGLFCKKSENLLFQFHPNKISLTTSPNFLSDMERNPNLLNQSDSKCQRNQVSKWEI